MLQRIIAWCFLIWGASCLRYENVYAQRFNRLYDFGLDTAYWSAEVGENVFVKANGDYFVTGGVVAAPYVRYFLMNMSISKDGSTILKRDTLGWGNYTRNFYLGQVGSAKKFGNGYIAPYGTSWQKNAAGIVRYNADGDTVFTRIYTDTNQCNEYANNVWPLPDSTILVCGERTISQPLAWGYVQKISKNGNVLWMKTYQKDAPLENRLMSIQGLPGGNILVGGGVLRRIYLNNIQNNYQVNRPWFMLLDSVGSVLKDVQFDTSYYGGGNILSDANGGYLHWGMKDSLPRILPGYEHDDINRPYYVSNLDTNFNMIWRTTFFTLTPTKLVRIWQVIQTKNKEYLVIGQMNTVRGQYACINGWVAKLNRQGQKIWEKDYYIDSTQNGYLVDAKERSGPEGGFVLTGWTKACPTCSQDLWLVSTDSNGCELQNCAPLVVAPVPKNTSELSFYPNPTSGIFSVKSATGGILQLYNIHGAKVAQYHISAGEQRLSLPADAAPGVYLGKYEDESGKKEQTVRIVYQP